MSNEPLDDYENQVEDMDFIKAVEQGLLEVQESKTLFLDEVKNRLDME